MRDIYLLSHVMIWWYIFLCNMKLLWEKIWYPIRYERNNSYLNSFMQRSIHHFFTNSVFIFITTLISKMCSCLSVPSKLIALWVLVYWFQDNNQLVSSKIFFYQIFPTFLECFQRHKFLCGFKPLKAVYEDFDYLSTFRIILIF